LVGDILLVPILFYQLRLKSQMLLSGLWWVENRINIEFLEFLPSFPYLLQVNFQEDLTGFLLFVSFSKFAKWPLYPRCSDGLKPCRLPNSFRQSAFNTSSHSQCGKVWDKAFGVFLGFRKDIWFRLNTHTFSWKRSHLKTGFLESK
jgi:hypothetical protein